MIFDSWGGVLADGAFQEFSLAYTARVLAQLKRRARRPAHSAHRVHQGRRPVAGRDGPARLRGARRSTGPSTWRARAPRGRRVGGPGKALAGQHRPERAVRAAGANRRPRWRRCWRASARRTRRAARARGPTHIFNLGHGISQYTPPEHVAALVEAVHAHSRADAAVSADGTQAVRSRARAVTAEPLFCLAQNFAGELDLCTKTLLRCSKGRGHARYCCYKTNSARKSLICIDFDECLFYGQSSRSLDFQGLAGCRGRLSTKLSTEIGMTLKVL